jgi:protein O-GlcNAc transferase
MQKLGNIAREFGGFCAATRAFVFDAWGCDRETKTLRIGLVGGDFRRHPVGFFLNDVLKHVAKKQIEIFIYSNSSVEDDITGDFRANSVRFVNITRLRDDIVAKLIHDDRVHILIDVAGHTCGNRLPIFSYRPAPIQVTWLGYCGTTGIEEVDYILADARTLPKQEEKFYGEKPWRLGKTYWCFSRPEINLPVAALPALRNGYVTFGSFNSFKKLNRNVLHTWGRILRRDPRSKLLLKAGQFNEPQIEKKLFSIFADQGIGPERLIVEGWTNREHYFEMYNKVDLALDPFPYPGGTTTFEGLWMGVPFITMKGDRFYAHNGETIAHNAGLSEWIAENQDDYVDKAVGFAARIEQLSMLRTFLREKILQSPLFDCESFATNFTEAMRDMWQEYMKTSCI